MLRLARRQTTVSIEGKIRQSKSGSIAASDDGTGGNGGNGSVDEGVNANVTQPIPNQGSQNVRVGVNRLDGRTTIHSKSIDIAEDVDVHVDVSELSEGQSHESDVDDSNSNESNQSDLFNQSTNLNGFGCHHYHENDRIEHQETDGTSSKRTSKTTKTTTTTKKADTIDTVGNEHEHSIDQ